MEVFTHYGVGTKAFDLLAADYVREHPKLKDDLLPGHFGLCLQRNPVTGA